MSAIIDPKVIEAAYQERVKELKDISDIQKGYLASPAVKKRILKSATLEELQAEINQALAETDPKAIQELSDKLSQKESELPSNRIISPIRQAVQLMQYPGMPPKLIIEALNHCRIFGDYLWDSLTFIGNRLKPDEFATLEMIYDKLDKPPTKRIIYDRLDSPPPIGLSSSEHVNYDNSRFKQAISNIRGGIPIALIWEGITLGLHEKWYNSDAGRYNSTKDSFFNAVTLVHERRATFADLKSLSKFDIELMFYVKKLTLEDLKTVNAKCPFNEDDLYHIRRNDFHEELAFNEIVDLNREQRDFYLAGFSLEKVNKFISRGVTYSLYDKVRTLFTPEGFELFSLDAKRRAEILKMFPDNPDPKTTTMPISEPALLREPASTSMTAPLPTPVPGPSPFVGFSEDSRTASPNRDGSSSSKATPIPVDKTVIDKSAVTSTPTP
jgi:hypothetical protein